MWNSDAFGGTQIEIFVGQKKRVDLEFSARANFLVGDETNSFAEIGGRCEMADWDEMASWLEIGGWVVIGDQGKIWYGANFPCHQEKYANLYRHQTHMAPIYPATKKNTPIQPPPDIFVDILALKRTPYVNETKQTRC